MSDSVIQSNEDLLKHDLIDLFCSSVEETLNALFDKEADELVNAQKYVGYQQLVGQHFKLGDRLISKMVITSSISESLDSVVCKARSRVFINQMVSATLLPK